MGSVFARHPDPLRFWARVAPARVALVDRARDARWTYAEFDAEADRWAGLLRAQGIGRGGRVGTLTGNRAEAAALFWACARVGAALVPFNWRLALRELAMVAADAAPALVLGEGRFRAAAETAMPGARWIDLDAEAPALLGRASAPVGDVELEGETPALVLYTSGSTGTPKGALLPHRQILWNAVATTTAWELSAADVAPVSTPFFHTGGWNVFATPLWHRGGRIVLFDAFDADDFLTAAEEEGITVALTVPTQLLMLRESARWGRPLPRLRFWISGGAPCPPALGEAARAAGYGFREGYGLTECGPNCFAISDEGAAARPGSVGWPVPFLEMRVEAEPGRDAAPGETGELLLRGPQVFAGYLGQPERTAEVLSPEGWLRTGDLASRDEDGAYRIRGRRKEMFISGGENVYPAEVEAALADCPGVAEVVVVGVRDERWGEVGRAYVVLRPEMRQDERGVVAHARDRLAGYKVPKQVVILPEMPRLGSGKPDRRALVEGAR